MQKPELFQKHKNVKKYDAQSISISGPSAVGKSTISRLLANALGYNHFDLDDEVCRMGGVNNSIEFFANYGHAKFKEYQLKCISKIVRSTEKFILAAGGEIWRPGYDKKVIDENRKLLRSSTYNICLLPSLEKDEIIKVLYPRLHDGKRDTRTKNAEEFAHYVEIGIQQYLDLADACIFVHDAGAISVNQFILEEVLQKS